jgi:hypothetical protein
LVRTPQCRASARGNHPQDGSPQMGLFQQPVNPLSHSLGTYQRRDHLVQSPAVAHGEDPEDSLATIDGVDNAEAPHTVLPETLEFPHERLPQGRIAPESLERIPDRPLQLKRKMPDDLRHVRRNVEAIGGH